MDSLAQNITAPWPRSMRNLVSQWNDSSFVKLIHCHWLDYEQASDIFHILSGSLILVVGIAAVLGNGLVIYNFLWTKSLKSKSNALVINLAICDLLMASILTPMYATSSFNFRWVFGYNGCQIYGFAGAFFGTASLITITAMALDRFLVICKPFKCLHAAVASRRIYFTLSFIWTYSLFWAIIPLCPGFAPYVPEGFLTTCSFDVLDASFANRFYIGAMCVGAYFVPLAVIITAYMRILSAIVPREPLLNSLHTSSSVSSASKRREQQAQSAKIIFFVISGWTIAWTPYTIASLLGVSGAHSYYTPLASHLPAIFAKTSAAYNPIVYAFKSPRYRQALVQLITSLLGQNRSRRLHLVPRTSTGRSITTVGQQTSNRERVGSTAPKIRHRAQTVVWNPLLTTRKNSARNCNLRNSF